MAKQSGLHQIRGKVGEYSYYRQTGVSSGLLRGINQGLSSRVKTGDEYANTRLNNAEFGAACNVAGELGKMVVPKYRPMVLPFSQSVMAKKVLDLAKAHPGLWGRRVVTADDSSELAQILTDTSKLKISDFMTTAVSRTSEVLADVDIAMTATQVSAMLSLGIDGIDFRTSLYDLRTGNYSENLNRILRSNLRLEVTDDSSEELTAGSDLSLGVPLAVGTVPAPTGFTRHRFVVIVALPYRLVGESKYTLQEYCMFVAYQLPDAD